MNRMSRRSAAGAADALLKAGRTQPVLHYDVELGLERHHHWLRSEAPLPEWASASVGSAAKPLAPVVIKTIVSAVLVGTVAVVAWHARGRPQPSAANVEHSSPRGAGAQAALPSVPDVSPIPMPVSDPGLLNEEPARRTVRVEVPDKHTTRSQRPHKGQAAARARAETEPSRTVARVSVPADATPATPQPREDVRAEQVTHSETAAAPAHEPIRAAQRARPEPASQAQALDDMVEMQQVAAAEQLLQRSPQRALALVRQGDQRFARGYFQQERAYIAIMALIRLGRVDEARACAASFAQQFPALPYGARIRNALEAHDSGR